MVGGRDRPEPTRRGSRASTIQLTQSAPSLTSCGHTTTVTSYVPRRRSAFEALDSPAAKAFVEGADPGAGGQPAASPHRLAMVEPVPLAAVDQPQLTPVAGVASIPRGPRKERMQPVTLR